jgi:hypothetical protein
MRNVIRIKPHHFIDFMTALGEGKVVFEPHPSGHADYLIAHKLAQNPLRPLQVVLGVDDVCFPCQFHLEGTCKGEMDTAFSSYEEASRQPLICAIDRRWCERLGIQDRETMPALDFCRRIANIADDISGIYAEIPSEQIKKRIQSLHAGLNAFLSYAASINP